MTTPEGRPSKLDWLYQRVVRSLLFTMDPESAHDLTLRLLRLGGGIEWMEKWLSRAFWSSPSDLAVQAFGLTFPNPVGLAAGYDKNGLAMAGLTALGFGHLELGTVTPQPQPGNPKPRMFRIPEQRALVNSMGFPNQGGQALLGRLQDWNRKNVILGVNIGKGADTPLEEAAEDYLRLLDLLYPAVDYFALNVSSPNTVGLRNLQAQGPLKNLIDSVSDQRSVLARRHGARRPLLVKLSPDLSGGGLRACAAVIRQADVDGVIATNTTVGRPSVGAEWAGVPGGLSGAPLRDQSLKTLRLLRAELPDRIKIVSVGGIMGPEDAVQRLAAGATLIQLFSGLIYGGPFLVKRILARISQSGVVANRGIPPAPSAVSAEAPR